MYILVFNDQISGTSDDTEGLPEGFQAYPNPGYPLDDLYFNGTEVALKPPQPSPRHYWDNEANGWVEPKAPEPEPESPKFVGTELFNAARVAARLNPIIATEFSVALYAENNRDYQLLATTIATLEDLVTS